MKNKQKNKYYRRSHISERKFRQLLHCFCLDLDAFEASQLTRLSHRSCKLIYHKFRIYLFKASQQMPAQSGEFELDESYFGARRVRGKRGRSAAGKTPVFGLIKRGGRVHVEIVKNCSKEQLIPIIKGHVLEGSTINTDGWKAYDGLVVNGYDHYRVYHSKDEFARGKCHVNGIESFWSFAKRRLAKFNGLAEHTFYLHLKETEFRFNMRNDNFYGKMIHMLRKNPL